MYEDILLPVDENYVDATAVIRHAGAIAERLDAAVQIVYVADTNRDSVTVVEADVVDALVEEGESVVAEAAGLLSSLDVEYGTDVVQGDPASTIVEYAERYGYDLIVMPTRGREGLSRYLLGSVAEKVVRLSDVPVLSARVREDEVLRFPYERVLVPTDGSAAARSAARHGVSLAAALDATVHALGVVDDASLGADVRSTAMGSSLEAAARDAVEAVVDEAEERGVTAEGQVEHGSPTATIREYAEEVEAHAIVMGKTGRRGVDRILLGSVAEETVRTARVPVVTVGADTE